VAEEGEGADPRQLRVRGRLDQAQQEQQAAEADDDVGRRRFLVVDAPGEFLGQLRF
jgi:hypothetical protein